MKTLQIASAEAFLAKNWKGATEIALEFEDTHASAKEYISNGKHAGVITVDKLSTGEKALRDTLHQGYFVAVDPKTDTVYVYIDPVIRDRELKATAQALVDELPGLPTGAVLNLVNWVEVHPEEAAKLFNDEQADAIEEAEPQANEIADIYFPEVRKAGASAGDDGFEMDGSEMSAMLALMGVLASLNEGDDPKADDEADD